MREGEGENGWRIEIARRRGSSPHPAEAERAVGGEARAHRLSRVRLEEEDEPDVWARTVGRIWGEEVEESWAGRGRAER